MRDLKLFKIFASKYRKEVHPKHAQSIRIADGFSFWGSLQHLQFFNSRLYLGWWNIPRYLIFNTAGNHKSDLFELWDNVGVELVYLIELSDPCHIEENRLVVISDCTRLLY